MDHAKRVHHAPHALHHSHFNPPTTWFAWIMANPHGLNLGSFMATPCRQRGPHMSDRVMLSVLYMVNLGTGYLLMLAVMTFNVGYFFAVVAGLGAGYFLFFDRYYAAGAVAKSADSCHVRLLDAE